MMSGWRVYIPFVLPFTLLLLESGWYHQNHKHISTKGKKI